MARQGLFFKGEKHFLDKKFLSLNNYVLLCRQKITKSNITMNSILKSIGLAIIVIAAIVLMLSFYLGWTNNNSVQFGALAAMIVGLIVYIIFGKRCLAEE